MLGGLPTEVVIMGSRRLAVDLAIGVLALGVGVAACVGAPGGDG